MVAASTRPSYAELLAVPNTYRLPGQMRTYTPVKEFSPAFQINGTGTDGQFDMCPYFYTTRF